MKRAHRHHIRRGVTPAEASLYLWRWLTLGTPATFETRFPVHPPLVNMPCPCNLARVTPAEAVGLLSLAIDETPEEEDAHSQEAAMWASV